MTTKKNLHFQFSRITISGQIATGKSTLFRALEKNLGWQTYSTGQFFRDYAAKHHLVLESAKEQSADITKKIDYQVRDLLRDKENIIVEGWMAGLMAKGVPQVLKVLLICADWERFQRFAKREKVDFSIAAERVKDRDANWLNQISQIYERADIFDPAHYDLVINTTSLSPSAISHKVLLALKGL